MKILFLDVDGVLNNERTLARAFNEQLPTFALDRHCLAMLADIVNITGAKIVISSTWRVGGWEPGSHGHLLKVALSMWDLSIHGVTPQSPPGQLLKRGEEIEKWLRDQPNHIESICILDDLPHEEFGPLSRFHVQTHMSDGLTACSVVAALRMLQNTAFKKLQ